PAPRDRRARDARLPARRRGRRPPPADAPPHPPRLPRPGRGHARARARVRRAPGREPGLARRRARAPHRLAQRCRCLRAVPLARLPLDGGATFRGRRLLGAHKTVRGAVTMVGATTMFALAQASLFHRYGWARAASLVDFDRVHPLLWGVALGGGYIVGELPNSFVKRRL